MKKGWLCVCALSLIVPAIVLSAPGRAGKRLRRTNSATAKISRQQEELMRTNFEPIRQRLLAKGVPFEPATLLEPDWRVKLAYAFSQMPEMQTVRFERKPLHGVYISGTLYLPERVELADDTVILAKRLVFEGDNVVIKGNHAINVFPVEASGVLGTTVDQFAQKIRDERAARGLETLSGDLPFEPVTKPHGHITIDTHGYGYKEWLADTSRESAVADIVVKGKPGDRIANGTIDHHGGTGSQGISGTPGADPVPVVGNTGAPGANGSCGNTSTVNGQKGNHGDTGATAGTAGDGGPGGPGAAGQPIQFDIPDGNTETWTFLSFGGDGGPGGRGGDGKQGGTGGQGGPGGDGADCSCAQGGSGRGGDAGDGGAGGRGGSAGSGGPGGNGGNGASISVTYPCNFDPNTITTDAHGGSVGSGGQPGTPGLSGDSGIPSDKPGSGATNSNCSQTPHGAPGGPGGRLIPLGPGFPGNAGNPGTVVGFAGTVAVNPAGCPPPPPTPCQLDCSGGTGGCGFGGGSFGCYPDFVDCVCECSPIVIDVAGRGFHLTNIDEGVAFDLRGDGALRKMAWTAPNSGDAFLALDRNRNGVIDNGTELFGNFTAQPDSKHRNGFLALAEFDKPENGGNGDGIIDSHDSVYDSLLLWLDDNHDGISQPEELHSLASMGLKSIDLNYRQDRFHDQFGNSFKYKSQLHSAHGDHLGHWAYDVYLLISR